jgi:organic radical activating enzyme
MNKPGMKGKIAEIFESIQGEGLYLGQKQIFVRFFGCNLNCRFCDTKLEDFQEYSPDELLVELKQYPDKYHSISFTGGEPLLQKDFLKEVLHLTGRHGFKRYLETNGTLYEELKELIEAVDIVAMDLKLPSSTGMPECWDSHRRFLEVACRKEFFLKAVICQSTKEDDLRQAINLIKMVGVPSVLVLQPNSQDDGSIWEKLENFREVCTSEKITACVIPQIHKQLGIK